MREAASSGVLTTVGLCQQCVFWWAGQGHNIPCLGLKRSFPNVLDLKESSAVMVGKERFAVAYLNEMPYCDTASKPLFQTRVTSQALVAERRQERKAETALPPTAQTVCVS